MINVMVIRKKSEARLLQSNFMRLFLDHILVCTPAPLPPPLPFAQNSPLLLNTSTAFSVCNFCSILNWN